MRGYQNYGVASTQVDSKLEFCPPSVLSVGIGRSIRSLKTSMRIRLVILASLGFQVFLYRQDPLAFSEEAYVSRNLSLHLKLHS